MRNFMLVAALLVLGGIVLADSTSSPTAPPQSAAARQALGQYNAAEARAVAAYQRTEKGLLRDLAAGLGRARQIALHNGDLDEANRVQARLDAIQANTVPAAVSPLAQDIAGSTWQPDKWHNPITYKADGTCTANGEYNGRWHLTGENTIAQEQVNGAKAVVTFTADRKAAVWQLTDRDGAHVVTAAVRMAANVVSRR